MNIRSLLPDRRLVSAALSIAGVAALCYLAGAAAMYFRLPSSGFLGRALDGARAWQNAREAKRPPTRGAAIRPVVDQPKETFDGFTLYSVTAPNNRTIEALLIDMRGEVVHRWSNPIRNVWSHETQGPAPLPDSACFFGCHLYPNGDLLAVYHGMSDLVRLDKDSKFLWAYPGAVHHDVDVAEDGTIYAVQCETALQMPESLKRIPTPCKVDFLIALSPEGSLIGKPLSILEALEDSPYADLLEGVKLPLEQHTPPADSTVPHLDYHFMVGDPLHTNCVRVLKKEQAERFPLFRAGQVLLSMRNLSVLAVLDPEQGKIVWAARGAWYAQHDPSFVDEGRLLLYDNLGIANGSRVLEYDPQTQALPWSFAGSTSAPFYSSERGMAQRLPNGNTFVVNSEAGEMLEVTRDKRVVWSCYVDGFINTARRYSRDQLPFLGEGQRPRPQND
ncbi:MAG TPA: arylsulfotransferase family protein [Pirellulales bacterium]|nr:arylsulfotransferase family protein [Pirellulales bacterium]